MKQSSSSSSSSSESDGGKPKMMVSNYIQQPQIHTNTITTSNIQQPQVIYQQPQGQTLSTLPVGVTEEQVRRSLAGVSLDIIKGEVRQELIPMTRVETDYKEEVQYEQVPRKVKVTDYYQVEIQEERIPQVYQHTITEYIPYQKIIPIVQYKAMEKTYTRPEIQQGEVRVEQGQAEVISTQIIKTESKIDNVPLPQIGSMIGGTSIIGGSNIVQQQAYVSQIPMKKRSSSSSSRKKKSYKYVQQPMQIQSQFSAQPIQMQTMAPVQTVQRSIHYTQPAVQTVPMQQTVYQQGVVQRPQVISQQPIVTQGYQPGVATGSFQGVRLADSHILMK